MRHLELHGCFLITYWSNFPQTSWFLRCSKNKTQKIVNTLMEFVDPKCVPDLTLGLWFLSAGFYGITCHLYAGY